MLLFLSGCVGYHDLIPQEFPQHKHRASFWQEAQELAQQNLKFVRIYDEFTTIALFDFLRCSDEIAVASANIKCDREGVTPKVRQKILMQALANNQEDFKFLLQADVRNNVQQDLDKKNSPWTFCLVTQDGQKIKPTRIDRIKHTDITKQMFGKSYSHFKQLYQLVFPLSGDELTQAKNRRSAVKIICRSSQQKCIATWPAEAGWRPD